VSLQSPRFVPAPDLEQVPEALAGIEVQSIARGLVAVDALVKKAASRVVLANPVSPGKFLILLDGTVAEVEESLLEAERIAGDQKVDRLFLPYAHRQLEPAVFGVFPPRADASVGIVECDTSCAGLRAADAALKAADVGMMVLHLSAGIGGKCWFAFAGDLYDVQASVQAASDAATPNHLLATEIIANPHVEFLAALGV
jgi:microcompartment protein CcmL/EutN